MLAFFLEQSKTDDGRYVRQRAQVYKYRLHIY